MDQSQNSSSFQAQFIQDPDTQKHEKENRISLEKDATRHSDKDTTTNSIKIEEENSESDDDFSLYVGWMYFILGLHLLILLLSIIYKNTAGIIDGVIGSAASILMVLGIKRTDAGKAKLAKFLFLIETLAIIFLIYSYNKNLDLSYLNSDEDIYNEQEPTTPLIDAGKGAIIILIHLVCNVYTANKTEKFLKHKEDQIREKLCNDSVVTTI